MCVVGLHELASDEATGEWWPAERLRVPRRSRKGFDSLVLLTVWFLWKERNARIFQRAEATMAVFCDKIAEEMKLWRLSGAVGMGIIWR